MSTQDPPLDQLARVSADVLAATVIALGARAARSRQTNGRRKKRERLSAAACLCTAQASKFCRLTDRSPASVELSLQGL
jgi:hypothetical protein